MSSTVTAHTGVAVHLHSVTVNLTGGVILDHTRDDKFDAKEWCAYHGVKVSRGVATLYKAVNDEWTTKYGTDYSPGSLPSCDDWNNQPVCGGGLHFCPTPIHALAYHEGATQFVAVGVRLSELVQIPGETAKAKAPRVVCACVQVNIDGEAMP